MKKYTSIFDFNQTVPYVINFCHNFIVNIW